MTEVLGPGGWLARAEPGFETRDAQLELAERIVHVLERGGTLAAEAPTGTGKTLAYLVPAILSGKKVLVSTHTKNLQDQLIDKDLPALARALRPAGVRLVRAEPELGPAAPGEIRTALMKGRANYLCLHRLDRRRAQTSLGLWARDRLLALVDEWARETERGDFGELAALGEDAGLRAELDARSEICLGTSCPRYEACFVVRMRREAELADVVIVNHHLLATELALGQDARLGGRSEGFLKVLPAADAVIVDEAHTLEEIATEHFGGEVSSHKIDRLVRDALALADELPGEVGLDLGALARAVLTEAGRTFAALPPAEGRVRIAPGAAALEAARLAGAELAAALGALSARLEAVPEPAAETLAARSTALATAVGFVLAAADPDFVYFSESSGAREEKFRDRGLRGPEGSSESSGAREEKLRTRGLRGPEGFSESSGAREEKLRTRGLRGPEGFSESSGAREEKLRTRGLRGPEGSSESALTRAKLSALPIDVRGFLGPALFGDGGGRGFASVVLTSATLSVGRSGLDYFLGRLGAPESSETLVLETPFDYPRQAALFVPERFPAPDTPGHADALIRLGRELIEDAGGGAFFLFTSHRMMQLVAARLRDELAYEVLVQGESPRRELLRRFVAAAPAVLFGTSSFWEGVDVPGDPLRLVIIDRLPFLPPTDPLAAARAERAEARGESPFHDVQVPQAILRLRQAFGRLIRTRRDHGVVAILDGRLRSRGYGTRFLAALPPAAEVRRREELWSFWATHRRGS